MSEIEIPGQDVTSYVLENAASRGERSALIDGPSGRAITYAELARGVDALAAGLAARDFGSGDALCIYLPNVPEYAVAFHGACRAGGHATTANPLYTTREVAHQLRDSGARLLLTIPELLETATEAGEAAGIDELFVLGESDGARPFAELFGDPAAAPAQSIDPAADVAVLPYSSGTTGLPKGVMLTHRNLVANLEQIQVCNPITADDTMIACLPFFHIYGQTVIMNQGLRHGATIVTMPRFDLEAFLGLIAEHRVTRTFVVPPIALGLAKHPAVEQADLGSLRSVMSGAAPLGAELAATVEARIGCPVFQGYGMTELSPVSHVIRHDGVNKPGSIGPAVPDTECKLIDPESGEEAGDGERGEVWVRGPQVMKGYLNNAEATAETIDADGWLHTGDVGVRDSDGYYEIVDRLKELIKFKGFQVAPAELEALIINHPGVADVAVIGVPDDEAGELPKAFVVPAGNELDHDALMAYVAEQVSPQKRIRLVEEIDEIPKSPSGKILRRRLRDERP